MFQQGGNWLEDLVLAYSLSSDSGLWDEKGLRSAPNAFSVYEFVAGTSAQVLFAVCGIIKWCKVREKEEMVKQMVVINHEAGKCDKESQSERKGISQSNGKREKGVWRDSKNKAS